MLPCRSASLSHTGYPHDAPTSIQSRIDGPTPPPTTHAYYTIHEFLTYSHLFQSQEIYFIFIHMMFHVTKRLCTLPKERMVHPRVILDQIFFNAAGCIILSDDYNYHCMNDTYTPTNNAWCLGILASQFLMQGTSPFDNMSHVELEFPAYTKWYQELPRLQNSGDIDVEAWVVSDKDIHNKFNVFFLKILKKFQSPFLLKICLGLLHPDSCKRLSIAE